MKIQYASDLHLEFTENSNYIRQNPLHAIGDILILAGDIGYIDDKNHIKHPFWDWASENYRQVIVCMGNHEFYKYSDLATFKDGYRLEIRPNIHYHYNNIVHLDDIDIIVSTLWAHIPLKEAYFTESIVSDFRRIIYNKEILSFAEFNKENKKCIDFINKSVKASSAKHKIVVTHHVPSFRMQNSIFTDSKAKGAFIVELEDFIKDSNIEYWIFGHSHYNIDVQIGKTQCITNQLGYVSHNEHFSFNPGKIIEL